MMKRVLFISYYWPPSGKATLHWPLYVMKHLPEFGWSTSVLTVDEDIFSFKDKSLFKDIHPETEVIKSRTYEPFEVYKKFLGKDKSAPLVASETISKENKSLNHLISVWIRMNLFIPDARAGWYFPAVKKASEYLAKNKIDAIVSVGPPHTVQLIGKKLSKRFNIPFVPVFIDPWTDIIYYKEHKRSLITKKIDNALEKSVIEHASHVVFVTETMQKDFIKKYPLAENKSSVLYWGYNEEPFENAEPYDWNESAKILIHAGNIFDYQNPVNFWKQIAEKNKSGEKIKIKFIGTVSPVIKRTITETGLADVTEYLGFLSYEEMISRLMSADYLMVCATEPRHVPGKLFEYLRAGKPIIAFGEDNFEVEKILQQSNAGMLFRYDENGNKFFDSAESFKTNQNYIRQFDRKKIAGDLSILLNKY